MKFAPAGPALIYWRAFAGTAVQNHAFVMVANLLVVNAGSHFTKPCLVNCVIIPRKHCQIVNTLPQIF